MKAPLTIAPHWVKDELTAAYCESEWQQVPRTQESLFEHLCLLIFQSGLGWSLVLNKRQELHSGLKNLDLSALAAMSDDEILSYLDGSLGIRNEAKTRACVHNARVILDQKLCLPDLFDEAFPQEMVVAYAPHVPVRLPATDDLAKRLTDAGCKRVSGVLLCSLAQAAGYIKLQQRTLK